MIKKLLYCLVIATIAIASCTKNDSKCNYTDSTVIAPPSEVDSLRKLVTDSLHDTAYATASGFYYKINQQGSGSGIFNLCSSITVTYRGSFFSGNGFDSTAIGQPVTFQLGRAILGWQKGVPLISKGGDITLYIPPSLAYGNSGQGAIPPGSYLIFNIHIVDIQ